MLQPLLSFLALLFFFTSCQSEQPAQKQAPAPDPASARQFLGLFKELQADTLLVYSGEHVEDDTFRFKGTPIDPSLFAVFNLEKNEMEWWDATAYPSACFRFPIDSNRLALIVRMPSEYVNSAVALCIWDLKSQKMAPKPLMLAEMIGDAGWRFYEHSYIMRQPGGLSVFSHGVECDQDLEAEPGSAAAEETCTDIFDLQVLKDVAFQQVKLPAPDLDKFVKIFKINKLPSK